MIASLKREIEKIVDELKGLTFIINSTRITTESISDIKDRLNELNDLQIAQLEYIKLVEEEGKVNV